jgi:hypothetical protein
VLRIHDDFIAYSFASRPGYHAVRVTVYAVQ